MSSPSLTTQVIQQLDTILKDRKSILTEESECWAYGYDNSRKQALPDAVVFPASHEQVQEIICLCNAHKIPLTARGRGTGTTGATVPTRGGIVMSLERMNRIIRMDSANRFMVVEPGVTNQQVQDEAGRYGFFWPPDPSSGEFCTVGGNLAYNSAGPRAVKYGTPRENTLGLHAVTGEGKEIRTGVYTTKGVVGYDLTRLLIGSEGTLAVITDATLKLTPLAECKRTLQAVYRDIETATEAVASIMAQAVVPCALEFIDGPSIEMIRSYSNANLPEQAGAMLMIEIDGPKSCIEKSMLDVSRAAKNDGLLRLIQANTESEINELWATRKALSPALRTVAPKKINEDIVVPVSNIPTLVRGLDALSREFGLTIINFGHAGNGNLHTNILYDPADENQNRNALRCLDRMFSLVLSLNGTLSGEHGVGLEKMDFIDREIDPITLELMRRIKSQFDPNGILNPGKMLPDSK